MAARAISALAGTGACITGAWAWNTRHERAAVRAIKDLRIDVKEDTTDRLDQYIFLKAPHGIVDRNGRMSVPFGGDAGHFRKNINFGMQASCSDPKVLPLIDYLHRCMKKSQEDRFGFVLPSCATPLHEAAAQWKNE